MIVFFIWQRTCENCKQLKRHGVLKRLDRVFGSLPDVGCVPQRLAPQGPSEEIGGHETYRHRLTMEQGRVIGEPSFGANLDRIREMVGGDLYTPMIVLSQGDVSEEVDIVDAVGADPEIDYTNYDIENNAVDAIIETPNQAARILVNRAFRFYIQYVVDIPTGEARKMRREKSPNPNYAHHLKPRQKWNDETGDVEFDTKGWIQAFTRAREPEY